MGEGVFEINNIFTSQCLQQGEKKDYAECIQITTGSRIQVS